MIKVTISSEEGQSVVEFIFLLPMLLGLTTLLININTAIQMGIVNQQYARQQALVLAYNSPFYPPADSADPQSKSSPRKTLRGASQMVLGVTDNIDSGGGAYSPIATQQMIVRKPSLAKPNAPGDENASTMGWVRIRNSVTLCTQTYQQGDAVAVKSLGETSSFSDYCAGVSTYDP